MNTPTITDRPAHKGYPTIQCRICKGAGTVDKQHFDKDGKLCVTITTRCRCRRFLETAKIITAR